MSGRWRELPCYNKRKDMQLKMRGRRDGCVWREGVRMQRATALQLLDQIMSEHMQVYVVDDFKAVCLTTVHPDHIEINCCAGEDRTDWQDDLEAHIAEWARITGKERVIMIARPGWAKWAKGKGYRQAHVELVRELNDGR